MFKLNIRHWGFAEGLDEEVTHVNLGHLRSTTESYGGTTLFEARLEEGITGSIASVHSWRVMLFF